MPCFMPCTLLFRGGRAPVFVSSFLLIFLENRWTICHFSFLNWLWSANNLNASQSSYLLLLQMLADHNLLSLKMKSSYWQNVQCTIPNRWREWKVTTTKNAVRFLINNAEHKLRQQIQQLNGRWNTR